MPFDEVHYTIMREDYITDNVLVFSFISNQVQDEVVQMNIRHLLIIELTLFNFDKTVGFICYVNGNGVSQGKVNHIMVVREYEQFDISFLDVHVWIDQKCNFQFKILRDLCDVECVMNKLPSLLELWIHNQSHKITFVQHLIEHFFHLLIFGIIFHQGFLGLLCLSLFVSKAPTLCVGLTTLCIIAIVIYFINLIFLIIEK